MDLVDYKEEVYQQIVSDYNQFAKQIGVAKVSFLPASAFTGENVVNNTGKMDWFQGPTLFEFLETVEIESYQDTNAPRFQVQYVVRPQTEELHDYRGYAGSVLSGSFKKGDKVHIYPVDLTSTISKLEKFETELEEAHAGESVIIHLEDEIDISRGSTIVPIQNQIQAENSFEAVVCWMDNKSFQPGQKLLLQQNSFRTKAVIKEVDNKINIYNFQREESDGTLHLNDFCKVTIKTAEPLAFDTYKQNRKTGSFILINENTNNTVAAGVIE
jgi:sulfate adenylyltransferase subunit 1